jgi:prepilin-type processing-associated H-X9-DG protein
MRGGQAVNGQRFVRIAWTGAGAYYSLNGVRVRATHTRYSSAHAGVANLAMCDGSVRSITKPENLALFGPGSNPLPQHGVSFPSICGMRDGLVTGWSPLGGQ